MTKAAQIIAELKRISTPERAAGAARFFKTKPGEYGYGDVFLGVTMPQTHALTKQCPDLSLAEIEKLLASKFHEARVVGVLCLVDASKRGDRKIKKMIFDFYLQHADRVNNWDLVDLSAPAVIGGYLLLAPRAAVLQKLSRSKNMWARRIAILATLSFIRAGQFADTFWLAEKYLSDREDLMHKATGWMLREIGKRDAGALKSFLNRFRNGMPRTMLRYAIERFSPAERASLMKK